MGPPPTVSRPVHFHVTDDITLFDKKTQKAAKVIRTYFSSAALLAFFFLL